MTELLSIRDITVQYREAKIINGMSLDVDRDVIMTVIGPNGAGKTTMLKAISGLVRPAAGQIWFMGKRIDTLGPRDIVRLGVIHVPERKRLFPYMSVLDNLYMGAFLRKDKDGIKSDLRAVFRRFPILEKRKTQYAGTLSGGEQQMLAIARGLMAKPQLLLLDEPSLGLAPRLTMQMGDIIRDISKEGVTVLLVEQNAFLALSIADKACLIERGNILLEGTGKELLNNEKVKKSYLGLEE